MSEIVYSRKKRHADRVVRVYLSLDCNGDCSYCSAGVPRASREAKRRTISPEVWAEGINRRGRDCILAGGEPFLYPRLPELVNMLRVGSQLYTNLKVDVSGFLSVVKKPLHVLASLHPMNEQERAMWLLNARLMTEAGHRLRFHVVKSNGWQERVKFAEQLSLKDRITVCDDQRAGIKSSGRDTNNLIPSVSCRHRIYLYGPDGYRYHCVTGMVLGDENMRLEHISAADEYDWSTVVRCNMFGLCEGCDNNIEGEVLWYETN